jgi:predicted esterase
MYRIKNSKFLNKNYEIPILQCHGTIDNIVTEEIGKKTCEFIKQIGFTKIKYNKYEGMEHSSTSEEMDDINNFLESLKH